MNIIVTGPSGFLASNIIARLRSREHNVLSLSYRNTLEPLKETILGFNPDMTIHTAWFGGNNYNDATSSDQLHKNIPQSMELLDLLKQCNKKQTFIGFGTACEYGSFNESIDETHKEEPFDLYGLSKLTLKNYSQLFCNINEINWIWIRPFYTYGPGDVKTRLIPKIITSLLKGERIILDECLSVVDYLYIDDFVDAIELIVNNHNDVSGVYNVCSNNQYRVKDVISLLCYNTLGGGSVIFDPTLNKKRQTYTCGKNDKLMRTINWQPKTQLNAGLIKTIQSIQSTFPQA